MKNYSLRSIFNVVVMYLQPVTILYLFCTMDIMFIKSFYVFSMYFLETSKTYIFKQK